MDKQLRILIVEDSPDDTELLVRELRRAGYQPYYERVENPQQFIAALNKSWDAVISDYSMPQFSVKEALEILNQKEIELPFIVVSGIIGEELAVSTMKSGAHDYVMKDNLVRLVPAVEREIREAEVRAERKHAEDTISKLAAIVEYSEDAIITQSMEGTITSWNRGAEKIYGYNQKEIIGKSVNTLLPPESHQENATIIEKIIKGEILEHYETIHIKKSGEQIDISLTVSPIKDHHGDIMEISMISRDITEKKSAEKQLKELAIRDGLTNLYNYREFYRYLGEEIDRAQRYSRIFSLLMVDIDHFKKVNDTYGHQSGDHTLRIISNIIQDNVRSLDRVARYGGEEICILVPEIPKENAYMMAEYIRSLVNNIEFQLPTGNTIHLTISIGVASFPADGNTEKEIILAVDQALYSAKNGGRNCVRIFDGISKERSSA